jgi:hypothetical protein
MDKKIIVIGAGVEQNNALMIASLKERFGNDALIVTPEETIQQGINPENLVYPERIKITALPVIPVVDLGYYQSGRERRRERRKKERAMKRGVKQ